MMAMKTQYRINIVNITMMTLSIQQRKLDMKELTGWMNLLET